MAEKSKSSSWKQLARRLLVTPVQIDKLKIGLLLGQKTPEDVLDDIRLDCSIRQKDPRSPRELQYKLKKFPEFLESVDDNVSSNINKTNRAYPADKWIELGISIQEELLLKPVIFFDNQRSLLEITDDLDELKFKNILENHLNGQTLQDFANIPNFQLTKTTIPDSLPYYIPRTLGLRTRISESFLQMSCSDIFLVQGIERSTLSLLAGNSPTDVSSNQVKCLTEQYIILDHIEHFAKICELTSQPVHLINFQDGNFTWIKSKGNISVIYENISGEIEFYNEEVFVTGLCQNFTTSMICICDTPGMGKSVLLANMARQMKSLYKNRIVMYFNARDWMEIFTRNKANLNKTIFIAMLANNVASSPLGDNICKCLLEEEKIWMEIMLDGMDEIETEQVETLLEHLNFIQDSFTNIRVWVTTRPHFLERLENTLKLILINMKPFDEDDMNNFLVRYWTQNCKILETKHLHNFSDICLSKMKTIFTDPIRNIFGIPLQCYLLADVYSREAMAYAYGMETNLFEVTSVLDLCRIFMSKQIPQSIETSIYKAHLRSALKTVFPDQSSLFKLMDDTETNFNVAAIIECKPEKSSFIHRTFAEYLVAEFIVEKIRTNKKPDDRYMLHHILPISLATDFNGTSFKNSVLCYFFDAFLIENSILDHLSAVSLVNSSIQFNSTTRMSVMISSVHQKCYAIFCIIFTGLQGSNETNFKGIDVDEWLTLVLVAARHANLDIVTSVCNYVEQMCGLDISQLNFNQWKFYNVHMNPLHVSIQRGSFSIFEYFIQKFTSILPKITALVHIAVHETQDSREIILLEKAQILKYLFRIRGSTILDEKIGKSYTPILMNNIHIELIKILVKMGADLKSRTPNLNTLAHNAATYMSSEDLQTLMEFIFEEHGSEIFQQKNFLNELPIHCAIKNLKVSQKILDFYFSKIYNEETDTNVYRDTLLYHLIKYGYTGQYVEAACCKSSKWKHMVYWDCSTTLLHIAVEWGNINVLEYLLVNGGDPNALDKDGKSPLHIACDQKKISMEGGKLAAMEKSIGILLEYGASLSVRDLFGKLPLSYALDNE